MNKIILFLTILTLLGAKQTQNFEVEKLRKVYDGDTFRADINCVEKLFCSNISIRVHGVDTPEKRTRNKEEKKRALKSRAFTKSFLENSDKIYLEDCIKGKYFRIVCKVKNDNGDYLSERLITEGLGVPYFGGNKKKAWKKYNERNQK